LEDLIVFISSKERLDPSHDRQSNESANANTLQPSRTSLFPSRLPLVTASFSLGLDKGGLASQIRNENFGEG
jgi:hypothetical protein